MGDFSQVFAAYSITGYHIINGTSPRPGVYASGFSVIAGVLSFLGKGWGVPWGQRCEVRLFLGFCFRDVRTA